jgi:hypothetical protein
LTASHRVSAVLDRYPGLLTTFVTFGFRPLLNPVLRRTLARGVTVGQACRLAGVDADAFLTALNDDPSGPGPGRAISLAVVDAPPPPAAEPSSSDEHHPCGHGSG